MTKLDSHQLTYRLFAFIIFCSIFSAFASYRLHLDSFIDLYSAGLEEIINGVGRAPDQYRYLPYLLLDQIRHTLTIIIGENIEWKWPLITFEATFLLICKIGSLILDRVSFNSYSKLDFNSENNFN